MKYADEGARVRETPGRHIEIRGYLVDEKDTVPCKWCETPTLMTHTKQCDECWELATAMRVAMEQASGAK